MALSNLSAWKDAQAAFACGTVCGAADKSEEKPAACGVGSCYIDQGMSPLPTPTAGRFCANGAFSPATTRSCSFCWDIRGRANPIPPPSPAEKGAFCDFKRGR